LSNHKQSSGINAFSAFETRMCFTLKRPALINLIKSYLWKLNNHIKSHHYSWFFTSYLKMKIFVVPFIFVIDFLRTHGHFLVAQVNINYIL